MRKRKSVKAWALMSNGKTLGDGMYGLMIYPTKMDAEGTRRAYKADDEWDVVPCRITFDTAMRNPQRRRRK